MTTICPTITANNPHTYREQIERVVSFSKRIHIDFSDGKFAPTNLVKPIQAWLPDDIICDLHLMYEKPETEIQTLISLRPNLIILHVEAQGNLIAMMDEVRSVGINAGVALLQDTQPQNVADEILNSDHVLVFGGRLGYQGSEADLGQLAKISTIKEINSSAEISWDGGVTASNAPKLIENGVDILNVGGFIQKAESPDEAYAIIESSIK